MQRKVEIIRLEKAPEGVFGVLRVDGSLRCMTLEPPDRGNQPDVSCIPAGSYACHRRESARFGQTWEITGVPGRTDILFHAGNLASDSRGCVLLGGRLGELGGRRGVLGSGAAMTGFRRAMAGAPSFELEVQDRSAGEGSHG
ncbi:MAG: DUF5675 family protein [Desulfovibrionaceae bacterium]